MHSFSVLTFSHPAQLYSSLQIIFKAILVIFILVSMAALSTVLEETGKKNLVSYIPVLWHVLCFQECASHMDTTLYFGFVVICSKMFHLHRIRSYFLHFICPLNFSPSVATKPGGSNWPAIAVTDLKPSKLFLPYRWQVK
jgi:hypothetical protein